MDKQVIQLLDGVIGVVVPDDANSFGIHHTGGVFYEYYVVANQNMMTAWIGPQSLPPGPWQILGLGDKLTEEQWKGMVTFVNRVCTGFVDYENQSKEWLCTTATQSGLSLLTSKGLKPQNTLILKRKA